MNDLLSFLVLKKKRIMKLDPDFIKKKKKNGGVGIPPPNVK